jgi:hypothetical protein
VPLSLLVPWLANSRSERDDFEGADSGVGSGTRRLRAPAGLVVRLALCIPIRALNLVLLLFLEA